MKNEIDIIQEVSQSTNTSIPGYETRRKDMNIFAITLKKQSELPCILSNHLRGEDILSEKLTLSLPLLKKESSERRACVPFREVQDSKKKITYSLLVNIIENLASVFSLLNSQLPITKHSKHNFGHTLRKHAYSNTLKILPPQNVKFQMKKKTTDIFHISAQNIDCGPLEPPQRGGSNEYQQSMFLSRNKKNNVYPCKPQFYYIKVGFKGVKII